MSLRPAFSWRLRKKKIMQRSNATSLVRCIEVRTQGPLSWIRMEVLFVSYCRCTYFKSDDLESVGFRQSALLVPCHSANRLRSPRAYLASSFCLSGTVVDMAVFIVVVIVYVILVSIVGIAVFIFRDVITITVVGMTVYTFFVVFSVVIVALVDKAELIPVIFVAFIIFFIAGADLMFIVSFSTSF